MDQQTREHFRAHVLALLDRALNGDDDAGKSLACMALLAEGSHGGDDGDGEPIPADVIFLDLYRRAA